MMIEPGSGPARGPLPSNATTPAIANTMLNPSEPLPKKMVTLAAFSLVGKENKLLHHKTQKKEHDLATFGSLKATKTPPTPCASTDVTEVQTEPSSSMETSQLSQQQQQTRDSYFGSSSSSPCSTSVDATPVATKRRNRSDSEKLSTSTSSPKRLQVDHAFSTHDRDASPFRGLSAFSEAPNATSNGSSDQGEKKSDSSDCGGSKLPKEELQTNSSGGSSNNNKTVGIQADSGYASLSANDEFSSPLMLPLLGSDESDLSNEAASSLSANMEAPASVSWNSKQSWWKIFCRNKGVKSNHSAAAIPALSFFSKAENCDDDATTEPETDFGGSEGSSPLLNCISEPASVSPTSSSPRPITPINALESPTSDAYDFGYLDVSPPNSNLAFPTADEVEEDFDPFEVRCEHRDDVGLLYESDPFDDKDHHSEKSLVRRVEKLIRRKKRDDDTVALLSERDDALDDGNVSFNIEELDTSAVILHDLTLLEVKRSAMDGVSVFDSEPNVVPFMAHEISRSVISQTSSQAPPQQQQPPFAQQTAVLSDDLRRRLSMQKDYQRRLRYGRRPKPRLGSYPHGELYTVEEESDCDSTTGPGSTIASC